MVEAHSLGCKYLLVDVISGGVDRIIKATLLFRILTVLGIDKFCISSRKQSYETQRADSKVEQFEQFRFNLKVLVPCIKIFRTVMILWSWFDRRVDLSYFDFLDGEQFRKEGKRQQRYNVLKIVPWIALAAVVGFSLKRRFLG